MSKPGRQAVDRGKAAEREAAKCIADQTGWPVRRKVGEGQRLDCGDLIGVPDCTIQVVSRTSTTDLATAIKVKPPQCEQQQRRADTAYGVTLARIVPGLWLAILTDAQATQYGLDTYEPYYGFTSHRGVWVALLGDWISLHREVVA
jgi:hypothetical protein